MKNFRVGHDDNWKAIITTYMKKILIYTAQRCGYCVMAKKWLNSKNALYTEINVDEKDGMREEMMQKTQRRTVPQIC